jgi:uridine kinase
MDGLRMPDLRPVLVAVARACAQKEGPVIVAVDGRSGVGKSTIARRLAYSLNGRVVIGDDFWTGGSREAWAARSPAERADGAIDWQRLRAEVIDPLRAGRRARWRTFNWDTGVGLAEQVIECEPAPVIVIDGAYSARSELADVVDVAVLVALDDAIRRDRLRVREGEENIRAWHAVWDPAEEHYYTLVRPPASFDVIVSLSASAELDALK